MPKHTAVRRPLRLIDLESDPHNANRAVLARSLREYGAGRAVLIDRHGRVIAGNKTVEHAKRLHLPLRVVKTDGQHWSRSSARISITPPIPARRRSRLLTTGSLSSISNGTSTC